VKEQQLIASCFSQLDNLITLHQRKLEQEKLKKKALMQLLQTGIVRG
jgi:type I restriction enzyme S subunit